MKKNNGGSAFPREFGGESGMSLRDWFAGMAMQGILSGIISNPHLDLEKARKHGAEVFAKDAYEQADAMIKEREKE